ncbi:uncharacterized protein TNCV_3594931 [Trichonephila clavipes]|nr:uncharacterized protein TNCV_3594931 [Trichonephila clavipes]
MQVSKQWTDKHRTTQKTSSGRLKVMSACDDRHQPRMADSHSHLQWAHELRAWQADWPQVVFSDKSRFNLWDHDGRIRVRRYAGIEKPKERRKKKKDRKRRALVVFGQRKRRDLGVLDRDADDETWTRIRKNALRTVPRQAVEIMIEIGAIILARSTIYTLGFQDGEREVGWNTSGSDINQIDSVTQIPDNEKSGSSFTPTPLGHKDNLEARHHPRTYTLKWHPSRFNLPHPEVEGIAGLGCLQEVHFSGSENVEDFIEGIDNQIKLLEIPSDLLCVYLKDHLIGRASYWCEIFGNPETTAQLLEVLAKFEERYSFKKMQGSRNSENVGRRVWNECRISTDDIRRSNWRSSEVLHKPNNDRNNYRGNYETGRQRNQWDKSRNGFDMDNRRFNDRGYQSGNRVQS